MRFLNSAGRSKGWKVLVAFLIAQACSENHLVAPSPSVMTAPAGPSRLIVEYDCDTTTWADGTSVRECKALYIDTSGGSSGPPTSTPVPWDSISGGGAQLPSPGQDIGPESPSDSCGVVDNLYGQLPYTGPADRPLMSLAAFVEMPSTGVAEYSETSWHGPFVPGEADLRCDLMDCTRPANIDESWAVLDAAMGMGHWLYTQGGDKGGIEIPVDRPAHHGDCTDFTMQSVMDAIGPDGWPHTYGEKMSTGLFLTANTLGLKQHGYMSIPMGQQRPGDIVVRGGHAGLFMQPDGSGRIMGWANNGSPAYPDLPGHTGPTGPYDFSPQGAYSPKFFRPLITYPCP
jgi:hypothetical protein